MALPALRSPLGTKRGGRCKSLRRELVLRAELVEYTKLTKTSLRNQRNQRLKNSCLFVSIRG
jgi:hypothetical protein